MPVLAFLFIQPARWTTGAVSKEYQRHQVVIPDPQEWKMAKETMP